MVRVLDYLSRYTTSRATGKLEEVAAADLMAALASFDVSGAGREEGEEMPVVVDRDFISAVSRELV